MSHYSEALWRNEVTHETFSRETSTLGSSDRVLGLVFSLAFAILALFPVLHGKPMRVWALVVGFGFLISALLFPSILHPLNVLWMRCGLLISKVTNPLITALMFYGIFTPAALVARALGRIALHLKSDPDANTYWVSKQPPGPPAESMRNQF